jgi:hypothetical protein
MGRMKDISVAALVFALAACGASNEEDAFTVVGEWTVRIDADACAVATLHISVDTVENDLDTFPVVTIDDLEACGAGFVGDDFDQVDVQCGRVADGPRLDATLIDTGSTSHVTVREWRDPTGCVALDAATTVLERSR